MKNYLLPERSGIPAFLLLCALLSSVQVNAQSLQHEERSNMPAPFERTPGAASAAAAPTTYWFNYGEDISRIAEDNAGDVSYFRSYLFPDSTVLVEFSEGLGAPWKHSLGQVFDPVSPFFSIYSPEVSQFDSYNLDSIGFYYRYYRFQDAAPDTLIVQVYEQDKIEFQPDPGWTSGASYATVDYDYTTRIGADASYEYTYLLTNDDTISVTQGFLKFPVDIPVAGGNKVAATITYIPGNPFNTGDTIDVYVVPPPVVKRNAFITYEYRDNDFNVDATYYNNQLNASSDVRYNTNTNGWNGSYIPGTAWNPGFYHLDMGFLITFDPTGIEEANEIRTRIFPNPAEEALSLNFSGTKNSSLSVTVTDVSGRTVLTAADRYAAPELKSMQLDIRTLTPGVYFCTVSGNGFSQTMRFVKK